MSKKGVTIAYEPVYFSQYLAPEGFLDTHPACHALLYYAMIASKNIIDEQSITRYEGERENLYNYKQLFVSCADMYGVSPEQMTAFWSNVDMQMWRLNAPKVPNEDKYRFTSVPEIRSH